MKTRWGIPTMVVRLMLGLLVVACGIGRGPGHSSPRRDAAQASQPSGATGVSLAPTSPQVVEPGEPFYGLHFVPDDDLGTVSDLGLEVILMSFPHGGTPADWLGYLDSAREERLQVIAWLWPEGWSWDGTTWQIDEQAELFVQTVSDHPALFSVYALHEPYWMGGWGNGYTTTEQQALYSAIKAIADVPIHSAVDSMSAWTWYAEEYDMDTAFADGICDYCETWYYPFREDGTYERAELISQLDADLTVARERAPNAKIVWTLQCFAQDGYFRMPSAEEMRDLASIVYSRDVAGALWYPWTFNDLYSDFLVNHEELHPVVREIYEELAADRLQYRLYLPLAALRERSSQPNPALAEHSERLID